MKKERSRMPIFGSHGQSVNNSKQINWWNDGSTQIKAGNIIYDGDSITTSNNNSIWTKNETITSSGNTVWTSNGNYNFSGGVMHGPNGEIWTGVNSKEDAMSIIAHKLR